MSAQVLTNDQVAVYHCVITRIHMVRDRKKNSGRLADLLT